MKAIYDTIGQHYNETRKADPYLATRFLDHLEAVAQHQCLDIGCGTGNYTLQFQKAGLRFIGMDPSEIMLSRARARSRDVDWRLGDCCHTGLLTSGIDRITACLTIHHWERLEPGFIEMSRILSATGRMVLFTSLPEQTERYWLRHYFPIMLRDSAASMPSLERITHALQQAGFTQIVTEPYTVRPDIEDRFLYSGKHDPSRYFDPVFRQGISSFSAHADQMEVECGLQQLQDDLESGRLKEIMETHAHELGDYMFILAKK